jgi:hypothetical protein
MPLMMNRARAHGGAAIELAQRRRLPRDIDTREVLP